MPLSSKEMIKIFEGRGWKIIKGRGKGSHTRMEKKGLRPATIPHTKELKKGLEQALLKQLKRGKS